MEFLLFLILAVVQGVTEFLPVSSSGHLVLLESLLKVEGENFLFFNIVTHVGTLMATLTFYRRDLWDLAREGIREISDFVKKNSKPPNRNTSNDTESLVLRPALLFGSRVILTTMVSGAIGIVAKPWVSEFESLGLLALFFFLTAVILWTTRLDKRKTDQSHLKEDSGKDEEPVNIHNISLPIKTALAIGLAQGLAVFPGISRSGITIAVGMLLGLGNREAMKYSILIAIPLIAGAFVLELSNIVMTGATGVSLSVYIASLLVSFVVGYLSLHLLWRIVTRNRIHLFAFYLIPLSLGLAVYWLFSN